MAKELEIEAENLAIQKAHMVVMGELTAMKVEKGPTREYTLFVRHLITLARSHRVTKKGMC